MAPLRRPHARREESSVDYFTRELSGLTDRVFAYRMYYIINRGTNVARLLEIKGLGADIASVKRGIGEIRSVVTEVNTEGTALKAELGDLKDQLKGHRADLRFEAETLGNGGDNSSDKEEPPVSHPEGSAPASTEPVA